MNPAVEGALRLLAALLAMYGAVICAMAATGNAAWAVPMLICIALAARSCAMLYSLLFFSRLRHR